LTGENKRRLMVEQAKRLQIPKQACCALSDSVLDLPLLEEAGEAIAVNPDRRLRREARRRGWKIIKL